MHPMEPGDRIFAGVHHAGRSGLPDLILDTLDIDGIGHDGNTVAVGGVDRSHSRT